MPLFGVTGVTSRNRPSAGALGYHRRDLGARPGGLNLGAYKTEAYETEARRLRQSFAISATSSRGTGRLTGKRTVSLARR